MKNNKNKYLVVLALMLQVCVSNAGELKTENPEFYTSNNEAFSEAFFKDMIKYTELVQNKEFDKALVGFNRLMNKRSANKYERAQAEMYVGYVKSKQGHHIEAAKHYKNVIETNVLRKHAFLNASIDYAKELIAAGQYKQSIEALKDYYAKTDAIQDFVFALEAVAQVKIGEYNKAVDLYKTAIDLSEEPQETWNHHLYLLYVTLEQNEKASEVLNKLRSMNPTNQEYWKS